MTVLICDLFCDFSLVKFCDSSWHSYSHNAVSLELILVLFVT